MRLEDIHPSLVGMAPYPPSPTRWNDISSFKDAYEELAAAADTQTASEHASRIAYQLLKIAVSSHSTAFIKIILKFWLLLGPVGRIVCVRFLGMKVIPTNVLMELVFALPLKDQLHILNELLLAGISPDPHIVTWAKNLLNPDLAQTNYDHDQALIFVAELAEARRDMSPAAAEYLRQNDFEPWLAGLLDHPLDENDVLRAAKAAPMVTGQEIPALLSGYIDGEQGPAQDAAIYALECMQTRLPSSEIKRLLQLLPHADEKARPRILRLAMTGKVSGPDKITAFICRTFPDAALLLSEVLPTLPPENTARCLPQLPPEIRSHVLANMLERICTADPGFAVQYSPVEPLDESVRKDFEEALLSTRQKSAPEQLLPSQSAQKRIDAMRTNMEDRIKYLMPDHETVRTLVSGREIRGNLAGTGLTDISLRDRSMKWTNWKNAHLSGVSFENMALHDVDFSGCLIENVMFHNCQLQKTDFTDAVFVNCLFQWSNFRNSSLTGSTMSECRMSGVSFQACDIINAVWNRMDLSMTRILECSLWGLHVSKAELSCLRIMATDFSHARLEQTAIRGCEFSQCLFEKVTLLSAESSNCRHTASLFHDCRFVEFWSDTPAAIIGMHESILPRLSETPVSAPPKWTRSPAASKAIRTFVDCWLHRVTLLSRRTAYAKEDKRRLRMGLETLEANRASALKLLPLLLESDLLEKRSQVAEKIPVCRVLAYSPDYTTWELAQKHFDAFELAPPASESIIISGVYTTGAFGSLGQLSSSPADLLICCRGPKEQQGTLTDEQMRTLRQKLNGIRQWAWDEFALELTFHVLHEETARQNTFGSNPHETAATAQAALIKDEIYATAIRLYGHDLLWRIIPYGAPPEKYAAAISHTTSLWPELLAHCLDLGPLPRLSPEKYVQALLWTAIKTFDRPYKALKALVRLLQCVERNSPPVYLSEHLKKAVFDNTQRPDPFVMTFETVREPYLDGSRPEIFDLLNTLFVLKTQCDQEFGLFSHPSLILRKADSRLILQEWNKTPGAICHQATHDFEFLSTLGKQLSLFMVGAFETVRNSFWSRFGLTPQESPELECLGRKLASAFRPDKNKIERLALVRPMSSLFGEVELYAEKTPGRPSIWVAKGNLSAGSDRREDMVDVHRDTSLHTLFAWLLANGFYTPKITMDADHSMNPISPRDVRELAAGLQEFFPKRQTFDIESVVMPDKPTITRAMFILNLVTARDINRIFEAGIVYSTNMGEMYCMHSQVYDQTIKDNPLQYLHKLAAHPCSEETMLGYFIPGKSRCPRPNITKYPTSKEQPAAPLLRTIELGERHETNFFGKRFRLHHR